MSLLEALNWRYAVKKMNGQPVDQNKVDQIIEATRLAPTSSGLQPFRVIEVTNPELKKTLLAHSFNQAQVVDCSHLLVFAAWDNYTEDRINDVFTLTHQERGTPPESTADYQKMLISNYVPRPESVNFEHAARQAYIGFGMAVAQAALLKVDATPMEGFDNAKYDEVLGLNEIGLKSVTILPIGTRDESGDWLVNLKKVRTPLSEFLIEKK
ncbi:NAD(P)H-dependent oxidoreductase [Pedobacter changchengzhani]|uniref:NAD(P)H-dependent oxidoreductase n=1 Tax=Pedobacter changchengzhani TaxID=2529274 RepID=A0A4R5MH56_9SPHI|nr:nitroreductase family protein [Pedobacter changchengzhani]TDG34844.1 NAD(P)H-dependent oxidoreductase [Pedobacter changchengzhani]